MLKLSSVAAPGQRLIRTITWISGASRETALPVQLEYVAPETLNEEREQRRQKVLGVRKATPVEDLAAINEELQRAWQQILADRILKIEGVTLRKLACLVSLDPTKLPAADLDKPIDFDQTDKNPLTEDELKDFPGCKTKSDAARQNILYLLRVHPGFRDWVSGIITDVSHFQDDDWEKQIKN